MRIQDRIFNQILNRDIIQKAFWRMLLVMTISELASSLAIMIDGIILTQYYGSTAVAAHGLMAPYFQLLRLLGGFFSAGTQVVCSGKIGKSDLKGADRVFTLSFSLMLLITAVLGSLVVIFAGPLSEILGANQNTNASLYYPAKAYLRGLGFGLPFTTGTMMLIPIVALNGDKKRIASATSFMMIVNITGDLLNVFWIHQEMFGMAFATSFSYICSFTILMLHFRKHMGIQFTREGLDLSLLNAVFKAGMLPSFTRVCTLIKAYVINIIYLSYAGVLALAANSLVQSNAKVVLICIATAVGQTTLIMTGVLFGEEDRRGLILMFRAILRVAFGPCLVLAVLIFITAPYIIALYTEEQLLIESAALALRVFIIGFPFICIKMFYIFYFQGSRNSRMSFLSSVIGETVYITLTTLVLFRLFGTFGLWLSYPVAEILYLITIFIICWVRCGHFPRTAEDLLLLPKDFDVAEEDKLDCAIHSGKEAIELSEAARNFCLDHRIPRKNSFYISLWIEEMAHNFFEHGFKDGKPHFVDLKMIRKDHSVKIRLRDDCRMFNPKEKAAMLDDSNPAKGIGLRMIFGLSKKISYINMEYVNIMNLNNMIMEIEDGSDFSSSLPE